LIILDGVTVPSITLQTMNQNDIESISILKDAAAAAIYGAQAAGGVILITSKKVNAYNIASRDSTNIQDTRGAMTRDELDSLIYNLQSTLEKLTQLRTEDDIDGAHHEESLHAENENEDRERSNGSSEKKMDDPLSKSVNIAPIKANYVPYFLLNPTYITFVNGVRAT
jgi:TonB-dependent SusC/RagA subfamily outer membrane receptor